ncbi:unnamed protein product [marine sediment metagenome]|uniref:Uncharacterized protein n=1 Tax=marine sediment metagenome TaxID=412755 RepID=X0V3L3_9ZZZZ
MRAGQGKGTYYKFSVDRKKDLEVIKLKNNFILGLGIGICVIAVYLMFKGWIETGVVILVIGIIMIGITATIKRKKK